MISSRFLAAASLGLGLLLSACGGNGPLEMVGENYPHPRDYPVHGIDVSKFQGPIDWNAVASSGVKFAYIKASEGGDHMDERFQANWDGAKAAGIQRGAYHFVYWCRPPMEEMAWFEQIAPVDPDALPPVLDVEATPTSKTCKRHLTQAEAIADMRVMLKEMERHYGKRPVIYSTVDFYEAILADGAFMDYPIWVRSTKYHPTVKYGSRPWVFWQYQSDARISGIGPKVDRNAFFGTSAQWTAFLKEPAIRPALPKAIETEIATGGQPVAPAPEHTEPTAPATSQPVPEGADPLARAEVSGPATPAGESQAPQPLSQAADAGPQPPEALPETANAQQQ
jgi:lysozyme